MDLFDTIRAQDLKAVEQLLTSKKKKPNALDGQTGYSALAIAADTGNPKLVKLLLDHGADPNYKRTVIPPLTVAVGKKDFESMRLLLDAGANIEVRDEDGDTPLITAAVVGDAKLVQELLARGANPKQSGRYGTTAIGHAAEREHMEVYEILKPLVSAKDREQARITLEIKKNGVATEKVTQLMKLAHHGKFEEVVQLIESGIEVDTIDKSGTTALMGAANCGNLKLVQWLLKKGADINRKCMYGEYPLSYAAMGCKPEMYDYLYPLTDKKLRKRAEKIKENQIDVRNWPNAEAEILKRSPERIMADNTIRLFGCARFGNINEAKKLVKEGVNPDAVNKSGQSPLMSAAEGGELEMVKWLIELGADPNRTDKRGESAIFYCISGGYNDVYDYLYPLTNPELQKGAEKDKQEHDRNLKRFS